MPQKHINTDMSDMKNSDTFRVSVEKLIVCSVIIGQLMKKVVDF